MPRRVTVSKGSEEELEDVKIFKEACRLPLGVDPVEWLSPAGHCYVCGEDDEDDDDVLVECDRCGVLVHLRCYGLQHHPGGRSWLCDPCLVGLDPPPPCALCPVEGGALKLTTTPGRWCHMLCAAWMKEATLDLSLSRGSLQGLVCGIHRVPKAFCEVCLQWHGACVQCCQPGCRASFHATCGRQAGYSMKMRSDFPEDMWTFCSRHHHHRGAAADLLSANQTAAKQPPNSRQTARSTTCIRAAKIDIEALRCAKSLEAIPLVVGGGARNTSHHHLPVPASRSTMYTMSDSKVVVGEDGEWHCGAAPRLPRDGSAMMTRRRLLAKVLRRVPARYVPIPIAEKRHLNADGTVQWGFIFPRQAPLKPIAPPRGDVVFSERDPTKIVCTEAKAYIFMVNKGNLAQEAGTPLATLQEMEEMEEEVLRAAFPQTPPKSVSERFFDMRRSQSKRIAPGKSGIHGWGVFAIVAHQRGSMVIEYVGETIRPSVADARERALYDSLVGAGTYMFLLHSRNGGVVVDATRSGNYARLLNHSCDPNCYSRVVAVEHGPEKVEEHIIIFAQRAISPGEELTYDYRFSGAERLPCTCGAAACRGSVNAPEGHGAPRVVPASQVSRPFQETRYY